LSLVPDNVYREDRIHGHKRDTQRKERAGVTAQLLLSFGSYSVCMTDQLRPRNTSSVTACQEGDFFVIFMVENEIKMLPNLIAIHSLFLHTSAKNINFLCNVSCPLTKY
jgi:hypothetical protein